MYNEEKEESWIYCAKCRFDEKCKVEHMIKKVIGKEKVTCPLEKRRESDGDYFRLPKCTVKTMKLKQLGKHLVSHVNLSDVSHGEHISK